MDAIKTLLKQFTRNFEKLPGWVPLLVIVYAIAALLPEDTTLFGLSLKDHREILVSLVTFLAYQLGDAIDKAIYKPHVEPRLDRRFPRWVGRPRLDAQIALGIQEGTYKVAKSLADAAGEYGGTKIQLWNELAKFARSVALPLILVPLFLQYENLSSSMLLPVAGVILFVVYLLLKLFHIRLLYIKIFCLIEKTRMASILATICRQEFAFFWDGEFIASERLNRAPYI